VLQLVEAPPELLHGVRDLLRAVAQRGALPFAHGGGVAFGQGVQELGGPAGVGQANPERGPRQVQGRVGGSRAAGECAQAQTRVARLDAGGSE